MARSNCREGIVQDRVYAEDSETLHGTFRFDSRIVDVFDDMVRRSVPLYEAAQQLIAEVAIEGLEAPVVFDLGCSTGNTILALLRCSRKPLRIVGVDSSQPMLDRCQAKLQEATNAGALSLICADLTELEHLPEGPGDVAILALVLQFIRPIDRPRVIRMVAKSLRTVSVRSIPS